MSTEYRESGSGRASSETAQEAASSPSVDDFEKTSLMRGDVSEFQAPKKPFWRRHLLAAFIHLFIFSVYFTLGILALDSRAKIAIQPHSLLWSPANGIIEYELQTFNSGDGHEGPYSGYPRPDLEEAWTGLLQHMNVRLGLEDLEAFHRAEDAVQLPDGSGYAGTLNVYHEIHCVRWLHVYMYQEHYYPDLDDEQRETNRLHSEHCLNHLRKSAMCHGDVGIITYKWGNDSRRPYAAATKHQCVKWDSLVEWTNERTIDMFKPGYLVHPTLGPVYREGEEKSLME